MQTAPESFVEKLEREFRGRLRIRWSAERKGWLIEQKVARGLFPGTKPTRKGWDESSDKYVQHRDGVVEIMEVRPGTLMDCRRCGHEIKVPFLETRHVKCNYCTLLGKQTYHAVVFMPLGDMLINHLKSIDPENPISERLAEDLDRRNEALAASQERDAIRDAESAFEERYLRVAGIPHVHLSGHTKMWTTVDKRRIK
jgi:hypothetical protein